MYILRLNPMTANAESVVPVAKAETQEALMRLMEDETVEPYVDGRFHKVFRRGGMLEWYNNPGATMEAWIGIPAIMDVGTREDWATSAAIDFDSRMAEIPSVDK